jgi:hypothetical protein
MMLRKSPATALLTMTIDAFCSHDAVPSENNASNEE